MNLTVGCYNVDVVIWYVESEMVLVSDSMAQKSA
jgi:hypothetical protein